MGRRGIPPVAVAVKNGSKNRERLRDRKWLESFSVFQRLSAPQALYSHFII